MQSVTSSKALETCGLTHESDFQPVPAAEEAALVGKVYGVTVLRCHCGRWRIEKTVDGNRIVTTSRHFQDALTWIDQQKGYG